MVLPWVPVEFSFLGVDSEAVVADSVEEAHPAADSVDLAAEALVVADPVAAGNPCFYPYNMIFDSLPNCL